MEENWGIHLQSSIPLQERQPGEGRSSHCRTRPRGTMCTEGRWHWPGLELEPRGEPSEAGVETPGTLSTLPSSPPLSLGQSRGGDPQVNEGLERCCWTGKESFRTRDLRDPQDPHKLRPQRRAGFHGAHARGAADQEQSFPGLPPRCQASVFLAAAHVVLGSLTVHTQPALGPGSHSQGLLPAPPHCGLRERPPRAGRGAGQQARACALLRETCSIIPPS